MRLRTRTLGVMALLAGLMVAPATANDLREAVPNDCFLAVWGKHNPERDYQKQYMAAVMETVEETKIVEKFMKALQGNMSEQESAQFEQMLTVLKGIVEPIDWDAVGDVKEAVYCQKMEGPSTQQLAMIKMGDNGAKSLLAAINNALALVEQASQGQVGKETETIEGVEFVTIGLPPDVPVRPYFAATDDGMFVFTTSKSLVTEAMKLLANPSSPSKFDDARLKEALAELPKAEDSIAFFDGKAMFKQLNQIPDFVRQMSNGDEDAERVMELVEEILEEVAVLDYEVTVEYTEGHQNRSAAYGKLVEGYEGKLAGKMFGMGKPFESWNKWVPANSKSYSLSTGMSLHPLWAWMMEEIPEHFPEAEQGIAQLEQIQEQIGIDIDEDILQSFTGESVSVTMPGDGMGPFGAPMDKSVSFVRCANAPKIKELMERGLAMLNNIEQLQNMGGVSMEPIEGMEGFDALVAGPLDQMGVRPVIGFKDGWMVMASDADAVKKVMETKGGSGDTVVDSDVFKSFDLPVRGPVMSVSYTNTGDNTRAMAQGLQQVGAMLPMAMGMAAQNGADLSKAKDFLALLPSVGKIIEKFDFYDKTLSVTQPGSGLSYKRHSVTLIKPPAQ